MTVNCTVVSNRKGTLSKVNNLVKSYAYSIFEKSDAGVAWSQEWM
jgi:hypothetical protein